MASEITGFRITGLHGHSNVSISITNNCVVLVGVNGLGKTTLINLLYYFLTSQWVRLVEYQFEALAVDIANETLSVSRAQIEASIQSSAWSRRLMRFSPRVATRLKSHPQLLTMLASTAYDPSFVRSLAAELEVPYSALLEMRHFMETEPVQLEMFKSSGEGAKTSEKLAELLPGQVLYLPTYRRIERDLEKLFPGLEEQIQRQRASRSSRDSLYLEFVEFGMQDVENRFKEVLNGLKERARSELNGLAASYLGEVIRGEADTYDTKLIASLDDDSISRILNRVEERNILNTPDKETLRAVIAQLKTSNSTVNTRDKYVGHFFSKLATIHKSLTEAEVAVGSFVDVCNGYLAGKQIAFDDRNYSLTIQPQNAQEKLELRQLSSGEKQIVSLFTHIYLGEKSDLIVLIDEPELSLSVPWQKQLLPDIRNSGRCAFLAAVTHSPFIYDNNIQPYATDLRSCIVEQ